MGQYQAGLARVTITPPVGMYLIGMERMDVSLAIERLEIPFMLKPCLGLFAIYEPPEEGWYDSQVMNALVSPALTIDRNP